MIARHRTSAVVFAAWMSASAGAFAAAEPAMTQIYQQRGADGRIVLTDRPSPTDVTERAWRIEADDPEVARQRAVDLRAQTQAVSERIQRGIDARRQAEDDAARRDRLARAEREQSLPSRAIDLSRDDLGYEGGTYFTPYLLRPPQRVHRQRLDRHDERPQRPPRPSTPARVRGSATLESR